MDKQKKPKGLLGIIDSIEMAISPLILFILFIDVILQIVSRFTPGNALPWTVEVGETGLGALIWFGISAGVRNNNHVGFDLLVRSFRKDIRKIVGLLGYLCFTIYLIWLGLLTIELLQHYLKLESKTTILSINMFWVRMPILIGCITTVIRLLIKQYRIIRNQEDAFVSGEHIE
ncbi:MAG TPA: TRAP transporter small permease [Spirochaetales bacterium]|nr:TRAP transporter small permease [Spirochaetales bacterium]HOV37279.1 TRAP transporter small permease [Spirochaetales bacterium]